MSNRPFLTLGGVVVGIIVVNAMPADAHAPGVVESDEFPHCDGSWIHLELG